MANIVEHNYSICKEDRNKMNGHSSFVLWFTGLSGSGKSTIANKVDESLFELNYKTFILDGDNIRNGINKGLSFTKEDRNENLRRIAEITKLFVDAGLIVLAAFVSPLRKDRDLIKRIVGEENFVEIFIDTSIVECERRDVKGLYKKARAGEIKNFTGIDAPYEKPINPDIYINTEKENKEEAVNKVITFVKSKNKFKNNE